LTHCIPTPPVPTRYYLELNTKQRKEWEQRLEELKKAAEEEVRAGEEEGKEVPADGVAPLSADVPTVVADTQSWHD
jgi:hypothetical protein